MTSSVSSLFQMVLQNMKQDQITKQEATQVYQQLVLVQTAMQIMQQLKAQQQHHSSQS
jgi:hypothetical protein